MFEYIIGRVGYSGNNYIILENNYIGYKIYINNCDKYEKNTSHKFYIYTKVNQNNKSNFIYEYYGFKNIYEKYFFELLTSINGVGPKTAMLMLKNDLNNLKQLIHTKNYETLKEMSGFNAKLASNVINQLSHRLENNISNVVDNNSSTSNNLISIVEILKTLGYKKEEIEYGLSSINDKLSTASENTINDLVSEVIKNIINKNENCTIKTN